MHAVRSVKKMEKSCVKVIELSTLKSKQTVEIAFHPLIAEEMDLYKHFPRSRLNFSHSFTSYFALLKKHDITVMDLLTTSPRELGLKSGIPEKELVYFVETLRNETPVIGKLKPAEWVSTGDDVMDSTLCGGIAVGCITEIFGESSTGKSQLCMQLTRSVALAGWKSVYISTESSLETRRLQEINPDLNSVYCINCTDLESQQHILEVQLPLLLKQGGFRLVIIDSISHHLRVELSSGGNYRRFVENRHRLLEISSHLNELCDEFAVALVVTNQISDFLEKEIIDSEYKPISFDYQLGWLSGWDDATIRGMDFAKGMIPSLGLQWSNAVSIRILLRKWYKHNDVESDSYWKAKRICQLVFSEYSTSEIERQCEFSITNNGIKCSRYH